MGTDVGLMLQSRTQYGLLSGTGPKWEVPIPEQCVELVGHKGWAERSVPLMLRT